MEQKSLFNLDAIPEKSPDDERPASLLYYLYFEVDGTRHYLYPQKRQHYSESGWAWLTDAEAKRRDGQPRLKWAYSDAGTARRMQRDWQRKANDGITVCIDAVKASE